MVTKIDENELSIPSDWNLRKPSSGIICQNTGVLITDESDPNDPDVKRYQVTFIDPRMLVISKNTPPNPTNCGFSSAMSMSIVMHGAQTALRISTIPSPWIGSDRFTQMLGPGNDDVDIGRASPLPPDHQAFIESATSD